MKKFLLLPFLLMACNKPETASQTVFLIEGDYAAALRIELAYSNLPRCPAAKLCSDVSVIKKLQKADDIAYDAIQSVQRAVKTPGFDESRLTMAVASANALTSAFVRITDNLGVK